MEYTILYTHGHETVYLVLEYGKSGTFYPSAMWQSTNNSKGNNRKLFLVILTCHQS